MHQDSDSNSSCKTSRDLFVRATKSIPGGVNSPARAFRAVGGNPIFIQSGKGPYLYDVDGNKYIAFIGAWGPLILGHRFPAVIEALEVMLTQGTSLGTPTEL